MDLNLDLASHWYMTATYDGEQDMGGFLHG